MPTFMLKRLAAPVLAALLLAAPAAAQTSPTDDRITAVLGGRPDDYRAVFNALQKAVKAHDKAAVAALIGYPIKVTIGGKKQSIRKAAAFVKNYDAIVTPAIAKAVEGQNYDTLFVNQQGLMFGNGEVWINGICKDKNCSDVEPKVVTIQKTGP